jgi:2'-5' RNA ligase
MAPEATRREASGPEATGHEATAHDAGERDETKREETSRRLFFALWPDPGMQAALAEATRGIDLPGAGRRVPPESLHLTLAFLGAVPESRIAALTPIAAQVAKAFPLHGEPIAVTLDHVEHWRRSQLLCATASSTPPLASRLGEALKRALIGQSFTPDLKPFQAHATFARKVRRVTHDLEMPPVRWSFRDFRLIESRTGPSGSIYSTREIWVLDESPR